MTACSAPALCGRRTPARQAGSLSRMLIRNFPMPNRLPALLSTLALAACATGQPQRQAAQEPAELAAARKAYAACAVNHAFANLRAPLSEQDLAQYALQQCQAERQAVRGRLPAGEAVAYLDEVDAVILDHLALRVRQARATQPEGGEA